MRMPFELGIYLNPEDSNICFWAYVLVDVVY